jgi:hypothetical protein
MSLSKDEQQRLDEIERALLNDDPQFAAAVGLGQMRGRRLMIRAVVFLTGLVALVAGEITAQSMLAVGVIVSLVGFVTMLGAAGWGHRPWT